MIGDAQRDEWAFRDALQRAFPYGSIGRVYVAHDPSTDVQIWQAEFIVAGREAYCQQATLAARLLKGVRAQEVVPRHMAEAAIAHFGFPSLLEPAWCYRPEELRELDHYRDPAGEAKRPIEKPKPSRFETLDLEEPPRVDKLEIDAHTMKPLRVWTEPGAAKPAPARKVELDDE